MNKIFLITIFSIHLSIVFAQWPTFTPSSERLQGFETRKSLIKNSPVKKLKFKNIGPSVMGGRVTDLDVYPDDPTIFYAAYASGGLWYTSNNGTTFEPIFDEEATMSIGDIAVNWKDDIIWVGTGENNSSRSSYSGTGIYKSTDGGQTWEHKGLPESHHIGRIVLHPNNPDIAWVAVLGHLYSSNEERGLYKTTDGGDTWKKTLYIDENTGIVDLIIDPKNSSTLYAASWEKGRKAWNLTESGQGSGIYRSTDGGEKWKKINVNGSGLPVGDGVGRIGLAMYSKGSQGVLYAFIDNQFRREKIEKTAPTDDLTKEQFKKMSYAEFEKLDNKELNRYLRKNRFPREYTAIRVRKMIEAGQIRVNALSDYLEDANSLLFETEVIGAEVYRSDDGGVTWRKTHKNYLNGVYNSYGYYFGQIRVSPHDPDKIYIMGVPILKSEDGGKTFDNINGENVHVDHHALWVNPNRDQHIINGNDGGVNISYDDGKSWIKCNSPATGQFYSVAVDMSTPYKVYGGLQDNGVWTGSKNYKSGKDWHNTGQYPYKSIMGGDGMQVAIDLRDNNIVYTGFQFGNYYRINLATNDRTYITPKHELGDRPLRWNWQTPIQLSIHNQDILYMGANKLYRSMNQGDDFEAISGDLTGGGQYGDVAYGTLTTIQESPLKFGLIYTGSDDGIIHVTKDGGNKWKRISDNLPKNMWVTKVYPSNHDEATVYVSLNGYRWDDFNAYVYVSTDFGETWTDISGDLPPEPVNVIKEDAVNSDLIYVGTDHGLYVSLDKGSSFAAMSGGLPAVAVHDLVVHPRDKDLIVATHGRSLYRANVAHLQKVDKNIMSEGLYVYRFDEVIHSRRWGNKATIWSSAYTPELKIPLYLQSSGTMEVGICTENNITLKQMSIPMNRGLNYLSYDMTYDEDKVKDYEKFLNKQSGDKKELEPGENGAYYLAPGEYKLLMQVNGNKVEKKISVVSPNRK